MGFFYLRVTEDLLKKWLKGMEVVIHSSGNLYLEVINIKDHEIIKVQKVAKAISLATGFGYAVSVGLLLPTGGLSAPAAKGLGIVSAAAEKVSSIASEIIPIEKNWMAKLQKALDKHEIITKRLLEVATSLKGSAQMGKCTDEFSRNSVKLGLATHDEVAAWQYCDIKSQTTIIKLVAKAADTVLQLMKMDLLFDSVPFEIIIFVNELNDNSAKTVAHTADHIWQNLLKLQGEYLNFKSEIEEVRNFKMEIVS